MVAIHQFDDGLTLLELVITIALSAFLVLGLIQIAAAASSSTRLQRNQAQIQEHARLAVNTLSSAIHQTGFNPEPWSEEYPPLGLAENSLDNVTATSDRLAVRTWSDLNCFSNRNPDTDSSGNPLFYIRETEFDLNSDNGLTLQCRYGPSLTELTTQVRRQGFIQGVESFQVLYGRDSDLDGSIEEWVKAGEWTDPRNILGISFGLLLSSQDAVAEAESKSYTVLDSTVSTGADGKLRRVVQFTAAIKGRTG
jgi:type IV pilus assembly protein PilW